MQTYITRPELVEAVKVKITDFTDVHPNPNHMPGVRYVPSMQQAIITGPDGQQAAVIGDWIIKNGSGRLERLKPYEFEARYTSTNDSSLDVALREIARLRKRVTELEGPREATPDSPRPAA